MTTVADLGEHARSTGHAMLTACYQRDLHAVALVLRGKLEDIADDDERLRLLYALVCNAVVHHAATLQALAGLGLDVDGLLDQTNTT